MRLSWHPRLGAFDIQLQIGRHQILERPVESLAAIDRNEHSMTAIKLSLTELPWPKPWKRSLTTTERSPQLWTRLAAAIPWL